MVPVDRPEDIAKFAKELNREQSLDNTVRMLLRLSSWIYEFHQVAYFDMTSIQDNNQRLVAIDGFGPLTKPKHEKMLKRLENDKSIDTLLNLQMDEIEEEFYDHVKGFSLNVDLSQESIIKRAIMGNSFWSQVPLTGTSEEQKLIDFFATSQFVLKTVKSKDDEVIGLIYGNRKFYDEPLGLKPDDKEKIRAYLEISAKTIKSQKKEQKYREAMHELRTPNAVIGGFTELLLRGDQDQRYLNIIKEEAYRAERILDQSRHLIQKVSLGRFNLSNLIEHSIDKISKAYYPRYRYNNHFYEADVNADQSLTTQIIYNLTRNAFQAMQENPMGHNTLEITYDADERFITASFHNPQPIPEHVKERLFKEEVTSKPGGTGIGLKLSKDLAEQMYGYLSFESTKEKGTTFYLSLPK